MHPTPLDAGKNVHAQLYSAIHELTSTDLGSKGGSVKLLISKFQADSVIAYRTNQFHNDATLCADNDQAVLCGTCCLSIKNIIQQ